MRERDVEAYLKKQVELVGGEVRKVQWVGRRGAPDRVVMLPGKTLRYESIVRLQSGQLWWVEVKAPGKVPEPHQAREHERMRKLGQTVLVIDSKLAVDQLLMPYYQSSANRSLAEIVRLYSNTPPKGPTRVLDV